MNHVFIYLIAFLAAGLALLSGFGLGTILTPVFLLFYEPKIAIFLVAIVHLLNNLLKFTIFRQHVDLTIIKRFGILALVGSLIGAFGQAYVANPWLKRLIGIVLIYLGLQEWFPKEFRQTARRDSSQSAVDGFRRALWRTQFRFPKSFDPIGGFLSGLIGGLVGNQGAVRSAFLLNYPISKETFIATGVVIACVIDIARIPVYWISYGEAIVQSWRPLLLLIFVTFAGTFVGTALLKRFSILGFRKVVSGIIVLMGVYFLL